MHRLQQITPTTRRNNFPLVGAFAATMFVSAALLFLMEPMFAKMVLPLLGGTPAVWNTCLVFFQTMLLAGYAYAHVLVKLPTMRGRMSLHMALLIAALLVLPFRIPTGWLPPARINPVGWLLLLLTAAVGAPFFVLSANTPVLQSWFSTSGHPSAADPYFLYAASNFGSLLGLLAYPLLLEPALRLSEQARLWAWGYGALLLLVATCAVLVWRAPNRAFPVDPSAAPQELEDDGIGQSHEVLSPRRRFRWVALAFVPSSLMLGVTSALTTDIPAIPLLWVFPLALYLLSFVFVFAPKPIFPHRWLVRRLPFLLLATAIPIVSKAVLPLLVVIVIDLLTLFAVAMVCHGELSRDRPAAARLTEFYLWVSVGGVLGGVFNALIAPLVFRSLVEFPIALVFAAALRPPIDVAGDTPRARKLDYLLPLTLGVCVAVMILALEAEGLKPGHTLNILLFGYSMVWCLSFGKRPLRFALGLAALILASSIYTGPFDHILRTERSFFGVYRVASDDANGLRMLFHGGTVHGIESQDPIHACEPLAYYTRSGPIGQVFAACRGERLRHVAVVGLGAGALASYQTPGDEFTFYEIDPLVARIATNRLYFAFIPNCAPQSRVVLGDARLSLGDAVDHAYGMIVLDAFSGDSIPTHLLTREAVRLYLRKLSPGGVLAFHISNRYLDLQQVLGNLAQDAGLACLVNRDTAIGEIEMKKGKLPSTWVVMAGKVEDLGSLASDPHWKPLPATTRARVWTDDFSNVVSILKLR